MNETVVNLVIPPEDILVLDMFFTSLAQVTGSATLHRWLREFQNHKKCVTGVQVKIRKETFSQCFEEVREESFVMIRARVITDTEELTTLLSFLLCLEEINARGDF